MSAAHTPFPPAFWNYVQIPPRGRVCPDYILAFLHDLDGTCRLRQSGAHWRIHLELEHPDGTRHLKIAPTTRVGGGGDGNECSIYVWEKARTVEGKERARTFWSSRIQGLNIRTLRNGISFFLWNELEVKLFRTIVGY